MMSGMSVPAWRESHKISEAHEWMGDALRACRVTPMGDPQEVRVRPWSRVFRLATDRGRVYLKICGPSQAHEAALIALLAPVAEGLLPDMLAVDTERHWLLLADAGHPLNDRFKGAELLDAWAELLPRYAELQRQSFDHVGALIACGVPDHRLDRLAGDLAVVISDERSLAALADDPLAPSHGELREFLPRLPALCAELASIGIDATVEHGDLHRNNVFEGNGRRVVLDWGDACVTHPFLSLAVLERSMTQQVGAGQGAAMARLRDAYLEPWERDASTGSLRAAARIGALLGGVTRALSWHRTLTLNTDTFSGLERYRPL